MTIDELSNEFDTQLNNLTGQNVSFTEYDKSIYFTKAQEEIFRNLYTGKLLGDSFEKTEQLRRYLSQFEQTEILSQIDDYKGTLIGNDYKRAYKLPSDIAFITYEEIQSGDYTVPVIPVTQDEYHRVKENPFRRPNNRRALRMDLTDNSVEIISNEEQKDYLVRYLRFPKPIIFIDLPNNLAVNTLNKKSTECELHPDLHRLLIDTAITYALKTIRSGNNV